MTSESSGRPVVELHASPGMPPRGRIRFFFGSKRALVVIFGDFFFSQMVFFGFWCAVFFFSIFFQIWNAPGTPPDPKKPWKTLYCHQKSRFRRFLKISSLAPLWEASGLTFQLLLGAFGLPGRLLDDPGRLRGRRKAATDRKKTLPNLPRRPWGASLVASRVFSVA